MRKMRITAFAALLVVTMSCKIGQARIGYLEPSADTTQNEGPATTETCQIVLIDLLGNGFKDLSEKTGKRSWDDLSIIFTNYWSGCVLLKEGGKK